jgi:hypothetical protein
VPTTPSELLGERGGIMQPTNWVSIGSHLVMGLPYPHAVAENGLNRPARDYCAELGIDPLAICEDEGLA